jgi:hypothetical protein
MLLTRRYRIGRRRIAVFVAVVGLHGIAGFLILVATAVRIHIPQPEQSLTLRFLTPSKPRSPSLDRATPQTPFNATNAKNERPSKPVDRTPLPEPSTAITLPIIDWSAEIDAGARRKVENDEALRRQRNLAGPSEYQLDWERNNVPLESSHLEGATESAEGGELIAWVSEKCYYTTHGISTFGMPETAKVCKDPPKPETQLFKDMRKKLDDRDTSRTP